MKKVQPAKETDLTQTTPTKEYKRMEAWTGRNIDRGTGSIKQGRGEDEGIREDATEGVIWKMRAWGCKLKRE